MATRAMRLPDVGEGIAEAEVVRWLVEVGGNWFLGRDPWTFFGQFERNSNVYAAVRCSW